MNFGTNEIIMIISSILAVAFVVYMLVKKFDAKIALFTSGIALLLISALMGNLSLEAGTGVTLLDPFLIVGNSMVNYISQAGIVIMLLFGYSSYMSKIGANDVTVSILTKPLLGVKSPYILAVLMFLVGNLLSIVVPSASSLAIILLATLYPVLKKTGMTSLTAAAIIATSASIMPTPLGADNVAIAAELGIDVITYVFTRHAIISIPGIIVMAITHYFWQKHMDKRMGATSELQIDISDNQGLSKNLPPKIYILLPLFPIILLTATFVAKEVFGMNINLSVATVTIMSFILAIIFEMFRHRSVKLGIEHTDIFFGGMGTGFSQVVTLVIGATIFVEGLKSIGIIGMLTDMATQVQNAGIIVMFIFVFFILLLGLLSGSGNSALYALIALVPALTTSFDIPAYMVTVPMQMASNLVRGLTPVAAVIVIVSSVIKENPLTLVKRTAVPAAVTMIFTMALSILLFFVIGI